MIKYPINIISSKAMHNCFGKCLFSIFILCVSFFTKANAQLKAAGIFGDNAIFQQGIPIPVWGMAKLSSLVKITLGENEVQVKSDGQGKWMGYLPAMQADGKAYQLKISSGTDTISYSNIMLGEVWLASGQSNMEYRMGSDLANKEEEIKNANYPAIRFRIVDNVTSIVPMEDIIQKEWKVCTPANASAFSAVAYFFARSLHVDQKVPVGIIVASRGATGIETWMSKDRLITHPDFTEALNKRDEDSAHWNENVRKSWKAESDREVIAKTSFNGLKQGVTELAFNDTGWTKTLFPLSSAKMGYGNYWGLIWIRKSFEITESDSRKVQDLFLPIKDQNDHVYLNGKLLAEGVSKLKNKTVAIPKNLLKAGKNILAIRMYVNWGTADIGDRNTNCYLQMKDGKRLLLAGDWKHSNTIEPAVAGWQDYYNKPTVNYNGMVHPLIPYGIKGFLWYQGENNASKAKQYAELQPMLIDDWRVRWKQGYLPFLYVQLASYKSRSETPVDNDDWAKFRDAQRSTLFSSNNTGMACSIDIGDEFNIHPANKQDVGKRLSLAALQQVYHQNVVGSGPLFKSAVLEGNRVRINFSYADKGLVSNAALPLQSFALADSTGKWVWANAVIDGQSIVVSSKDILLPVKVQYAWQSNPIATLYNSSGLPMVPFNEKVTQLNK